VIMDSRGEIIERRSYDRDDEPCSLTRSESIEIMVKLHDMCGRLSDLERLNREVRDEIIRRQTVFERMEKMENKIDMIHEGLYKGKGIWIATTAITGIAIGIISYVTGMFDDNNK